MIKIYGLILILFLTGFAYAEEHFKPEWRNETLPPIPQIIKPCEEKKIAANTAAMKHLKWVATKREPAILLQIIKILLMDKGFDGLSEDFKNKVTKYFMGIQKQVKVETHYMLNPAGMRLLIQQMSLPIEYINCVEKILIDAEKKETLNDK